MHNSLGSELHVLIHTSLTCVVHRYMHTYVGMCRTTRNVLQFVSGSWWLYYKYIHWGVGGFGEGRPKG